MTTPLAVPISRASKIVQNVVWSKLWLIINSIDWNDQTGKRPHLLITHKITFILFVPSFHEVFPILAKREMCRSVVLLEIYGHRHDEFVPVS